MGNELYGRLITLTDQIVHIWLGQLAQRNYAKWTDDLRAQLNRIRAIHADRPSDADIVGCVAWSSRLADAAQLFTDMQPGNSADDVDQALMTGLRESVHALKEIRNQFSDGVLQSRSTRGDETSPTLMLEELQRTNGRIANLRLDSEALQLQLGKLTNDVAQPVQEARSLLANTRELVGQAADQVLSGNFWTQAANEERLADWFRVAAMCTLAATIYFVWIAFVQPLTFHHLSPDVVVKVDSSQTWGERFASKVAFSLFLSIGAAYLARESAKHRHNQLVYRQRALDLKTLGPYVDNILHPELRDKVRVMVAERMFGSTPGSANVADAFPIGIQEILLKLIERLPEPENGKAGGGKG